MAKPSVPQLKKFKEAAREAECDPSPDAFDKALKKVAKAATKQEKPAD